MSPLCRHLETSKAEAQDVADAGMPPQEPAVAAMGASEGAEMRAQVGGFECRSWVVTHNAKHCVYHSMSSMSIVSYGLKDTDPHKVRVASATKSAIAGGGLP